MRFHWVRENLEIVETSEPVFQFVAPPRPGVYWVQARVFNAHGMAFSDRIVVTVLDPPAVVPLVRGLSNLSIRSTSGGNGQPLTIGFSSEGNGTLPVLLRAIGPDLVHFSLQGVLPAPCLALYSGVGQVAHADNWGADGMAPIMGAFARRVGAFELSDSLSLDSAMISVIDGPRTIQVGSSVQGGSGIVLAEVYDAACNPSARLVNGSAMNFVGTGDQLLILGFVLSGSTPAKVLIRGIGPSLSAFGVGNVLAHPSLELHARANGQDKLIASNSGWGGAPDLSSAFSTVGAFSLGATSADAAMLVTLEPGCYTALVRGQDASTGVALVELYLLP
jgi:hypothetical protein